MLLAALLLHSVLSPPAIQEPIEEGSEAFELEPLAQGTSLAEDSGLAERIERARIFLNEARYEEAIPLLQEAAEADPASLVRVESEGLLRGGAATARALLLDLPEPAVEYRRRLVGDRAERELENALSPPNIAALQRVAWRFAGLKEGVRAGLAIEELLADRGERQPTELASAWDQGIAGGGATAPARTLAVSGPNDPQLPRLRPSDLPREISWQFDFETSSLGSVQTSHRMVFGDGLGYLSDGHEVVALELGTGRPRWRFEVPQSDRPVNMRAARSMADAESPHRLSIPVLHDGVLLVVMQEKLAVGEPDTYSRIDIRRVLPARRLYAFDASTGDILWVQQVPWTDPAQDAKVQFAAGPPAAAEGRVYLPVYDAVGTVDLSLLCLDLWTGTPLWKRFLISGQLVSNLFGNPLTELAVPPPIVEDGRVLVCSHLGGICAVEAGTGAVLWTRLYERMPVRTFESGRIAQRITSFAPSMPASDGKTYVCAPVDGPAALMLDVVTGEVRGEFPSKGPSGLFLRTLFGMDAEGALVNGTRLAHLDFDGLAASRFTSPVTPEQSGFTPSGHGALMIRGEVLVPGRRVVHRFEWPSMRELGEVLQQPNGDYRRSGTLQATHGLLLVMRIDGVDAYASPAALLETLLADDLTPGQLRSILPLLEQFGFHGDGGFARQVGDAALRLADRAEFRSQADSLRLLASRSLLAVDDFERAVPVLGGLLASEDAETRYAAAGTLLDVLPREKPDDPRLALALTLLRHERPAEVPMPDRRREPLAAVLARADLVVATRQGDLDRRRELLVRTLLLQDPGTVSIDGQPLHSWASRDLRNLVIDPNQAARLDAEAEQIFASSAASDAELRAYAPSAAAQRWLRAKIEAAPAFGPERVRVLRWCRTYGSPAGDWPELREALAPAPPPALPQELTPLARFDLRGQRVLSSQVHDGKPHLFLQTSNQSSVRVLRFDDSWVEVARLSLQAAPGPRRVPPLTKHTFPTDNGIALIFGNRWMHIDIHGERVERVLSSRVHSSPVQLGSMAAVLLRSGLESMRLEVLDLRSGATFLTQDVARRESQMQYMICTSRWLFLLQDRSTRVVRIDLQQDRPPTVFSLPFMANNTEMEAATAFGGGIALVMQQPGRAFMVQVADPALGYPRLHLPENVNASPFRPAQGYAWLLASSRTTSRPDARPPSVLQWLDPENSEEPWSFPLETGKVVLPQVPPYWRSNDLGIDQQVVVLSPAGEQDLKIQAIALGEGEVWQTEVSDLGFDDLVSVLPQPARAAQGWALLLGRNLPLGDSPALDLLLLDDEGTLTARYPLSARTHDSRNRTVSLMDGLVLVRNGDALTFLGDPR